MASRIFQPWQKKRGHRRTGSALAGSVGEGVVFASMWLVGSFALIALVTSRIVDIPGLSSLNAGSGLWLSVIVLASLILIGAGGAIWTFVSAGTSTERRRAITDKADIELRSQLFPDAKKYPSIPHNENLFNSPGIHLAYRLPCVTTSALNLLAFAGLCLMVNGVLAAITVIVTKGLLSGDDQWLLTLALLPLIFLSGRLTWNFLGKLRDTIQLGTTSVEVSGLPFYPGQRYEICLSQIGRKPIRSIKVQLACDETATFREGTDVRNESRRVNLHRIFHCSPQEIHPKTSFAHHSELVMPSHVMHSFQSNSNSIQWKLLVEGVTDSGNEFEREFPVVVYPRTLED